jgi:chromosome segregation ATPase
MEPSKGLLRRAIAFRKRLNSDRLQQNQKELIDDESGITIEERDQIFSEIDEIINENKIEIKPDTFSFQFKKTGTRLPLVINIIAIIVIAAGTFLLTYLFNRQETSITARSSSLVTTEAKLVQELKEESQQKLSAKEQEISTIRSRLQEIDQERRDLQEGFDERLQEQEQELREEMEEQLAAERARLEGQGISETEIEERMASMRSRQQEDFQAQLQSVRRSLQTELEEKEAEIEKVEQEYRQSLQTAEKDQQELEIQLREREAEKSEIAARLDQIQRQKEQEQLVLDQINSYYDKVNRQIRTGNYPSALETLEDLKAYVSQESLTAFPNIEDRKQVDLLTIESFTQLLERQVASEAQRQNAAQVALKQIETVEMLVEEANELYTAGNREDAQKSYEQALAEIPAVSTGYERVLSIEEENYARERQRMEAVIAERESEIVQLEGELARTEVTRGGLQSDLDRLKNLLEERTAQLNAVEERLSESKNELATVKENLEERNAEIAALESELEEQTVEYQRTEFQLRDSIASLKKQLHTFERKGSEISTILTALESDTLSRERREYTGEKMVAEKGTGKDSAGKSGAAERDGTDNLVKMLSTKLTLKRVLDTERVREQYPTLYEDMDTYIRALRRESVAEGKQLALEDMNEIISTLNRSEESAVGTATGIWNTYDEEKERTSLIHLFENIQRLLAP